MKYKKHDHIREVEIQNKLYNSCIEAGLTCELQYIVNPNQQYLPKEYRESTCVFDLIVIEAYEIIAIVEVKDSNCTPIVVEGSKQIEKYNQFNLPVFVLYSAHDIPYLVKKLLEVRDKFLQSCDSNKAKCFEADIQNEKKWGEKIAEAFVKFDLAFPNYKFTNECSLKTLADAVRILGLSDVLKLMDESKGNIQNFFFSLNASFEYNEWEKAQIMPKDFLDPKSIYCPVSAYLNETKRIDEKLK